MPSKPERKREIVGRPRGSKDRYKRQRRTRLEMTKAEAVPVIAAEVFEMPLYQLMRRIADPELDEKYRDMLRIAVLPYCHPRAFTKMAAKPYFMMTDEELIEVRKAEAEHERQIELSRAQLRLIKGD